jgi:hypothetical protein
MTISGTPLGAISTTNRSEAVDPGHDAPHVLLALTEKLEKLRRTCPE